MILPNRAQLLGLAFLTTVATSAAAQSLLNQYGEIVLGSGQAPPSSNGIATDFPLGTTMGVTSAFWTAPSTDLHGTEIFRARCLDDAGLGITASNGWAFYMGRSNSDLRMIVRGSDQAPGLAPGILLRNGTGTTLNALGAMRISPTGEILVWGSVLNDNNVTVTSANDSVMYWGPAGSFLVLAREGDLVPGLVGGEVYGPMPTSNNQDFLVNASGMTVLKNAMLAGGSVTTMNDTLVLAGTPGLMAVIAREGDLWPGAGATGERLDRFSGNSNQVIWSTTNLNEAGQILHDVHFQLDALTTPAVTTANDRALCIWASGTDILVAREGDQAPGLGAGAVFTDPSAFSGCFNVPQGGFNKSGTFVFQSQLPVGPGGVTTMDDQCVFIGSVGSLSLAIREGEAAPASLGAGVLIGTPNTNSLSLNDAGQLAFVSTLSGTGITTANDSAVFTGTPGNFTVVAREGDAVPGLVGFTFQPITANPLLLNNHGNIAFSQTVYDGVTVKPCWFSWSAENGLRLFYDGADIWTLPLGATTLPAQGLSSAGTIQSGDTGAVMFGNNGEFTATLIANTSEPVLRGCAIIKGHVGSLVGRPTSVPVVGGVPHNMFLDVGPNYGNQFYFILATGLGTRPGFPHPLNFGITVPMNFDPTWTTVSQAFVNTALWTNTLFVTDANGQPLGNPAISFNMPPGFPGFLGTTLHHSALLFDGALVGTFATEPVAVKLN